MRRLAEESKPLLSSEDKKIIIEEYWSRLKEKVELIFVNTRSERCKYCNLIKQLYEELIELSDKLHLREFYIEDKLEELRNLFKIKGAPVVVLKGVNKGLIKFYGIPSGLEFPSFIETIVRVSRGEVDLPENIIEEVKSIDKYVNIQVFITPSCPYCPKMVSTAYMFAIINSNIDAEAWETIEFPEVSEYYKVSAVPKIVINDIVQWEGLVPPEYLLHNIYYAIYPEKAGEGVKKGEGVERIK